MAKAERRQAKPRERTSNISELADFAGVSRNTIYEWMKIPGFPIAADRTVCKWEMCEWYVSRSVSHESAGNEDDPYGGDSPGLERFRNARAGQEEIKLAQLRGQVVDLEWIHMRQMEIAALLRACGEQLQREYGDDALQILNDTLDEAEKKIEEMKPEEPEETSNV